MLAQNQRHVMKNVGEKPTDEESDKMINETDVDDAQQRPPGMSEGDSAGAGFRMNCGRNGGSHADQNTGARAESYGEADRSSCPQHSTGANPRPTDRRHARTTGDGEDQQSSENHSASCVHTIPTAVSLRTESSSESLNKWQTHMSSPQWTWWR